MPGNGDKSLKEQLIEDMVVVDASDKSDSAVDGQGPKLKRAEDISVKELLDGVVPASDYHSLRDMENGERKQEVKESDGDDTGEFQHAEADDAGEEDSLLFKDGNRSQATTNFSPFRRFSKCEIICALVLVLGALPVGLLMLLTGLNMALGGPSEGHGTLPIVPFKK